MPSTRPTPSVLVALALALVAPLALTAAVGAAFDLGPAWWTGPPLSRSAAAGTTLAISTCLLLTTAGVCIPAGWLGVASVSAYVAASFVTLLTLAGPAAASSLLTGHLVLAVAGHAALAAGALARRVCANPLDAAGVTLGAIGLLIVALLALGPAAPVVPTWVVNLLLRCNPVIAVTAAADLDLLRTGAIYRLSPVAHWRFDYPGWLSSALTYAGAAAALTACSRLHRAPGTRA